MVGNNKLDLWVREVHEDFYAMSFRVDQTLFSGRSPFQQIDIVHSTGHGNILLNDGIVQISQRDEFIYHEMIAHVPLFVHPAPRRVLLIGGGDGGGVREILRHPGVERVVWVEIDDMVISACREHMPEVGPAWDDPRLELRINDGIRYAKETRDVFDVVIVDSTDPIGPGQPLFNTEFYRAVAELLTNDGILVTQAESIFYETRLQRRLLSNQRPYFEKLHLYLFSTLTYAGGLWSFSFASKGLCPLTDFDPRRVLAADMDTRYYSSDVHRAAFMLPPFAWKDLGDILDPIAWPTK